MSLDPFTDGNGRTGRIINILYLVLIRSSGTTGRKGKSIFKCETAEAVVGRITRPCQGHVLITCPEMAIIRTCSKRL